jgi:hypothetical protein
LLLLVTCESYSVLAELLEFPKWLLSCAQQLLVLQPVLLLLPDRVPAGLLPAADQSAATHQVLGRDPQCLLLLMLLVVVVQLLL